MKECSECNTTKEDVEFRGLNGRDTKKCTDCRLKERVQANIRRQRRLALGICACGNNLELESGRKACINCRQRVSELRKDAIIAKFEYKKGKKCEHCGETDWRCLEFDHIEGKDYNIADVRSVNSFHKEVDKTRLLCAICHKIRTTEQVGVSSAKRSKRRKDNRLFLDTYKISRGCAVCGYTNHEYPSTLLFDHIDRSTKLFQISYGLDKTFEELEHEASKCRILCFNCERKHTRVQLGWYDPSVVLTKE